MAHDPALRHLNGGRVRVRRPKVLVYAALVAAQICWASSWIINRIGLQGISPVMFLVVREALAAPLLLALAALSSRDPATGRRKSIWVGRNCWQFGITGFFIFGDQFFTLLGLKLTDATSGAAWQPSICVFATALSCSLGWEALSKRKVIGITTTVVGSVLMVLLEVGGSHSSGINQQDQKLRILGQLCFLCNCMCSASLLVYSKKVLSNLGAVGVLAWSYVFCAILMVWANLIIYASGILNFICDDCSGGSWHLPHQSLWAVLYSVICSSCLAYILTLWANQHVPASTTSQFLTVQPLAATAFQCILIFFCFNPHGVLTLPGWNVLGGVFVILGLLVTNSGYTSKDEHGPDGEKPTVDHIIAVDAAEDSLPALPR